MNIFTFTLLILTTATLSLLLYLSIKHLNNTTQKTIDLAEHHNAIIKNICTIAYAAAEFEKTLDKETPEYQRLNTEHFQTIRLYTRISNITFPRPNTKTSATSSGRQSTGSLTSTPSSTSKTLAEPTHAGTLITLNASSPSFAKTPSPMTPQYKKSTSTASTNSSSNTAPKPSE